MSTVDNSVFDLIVTQWIADLKSKDRSRNHVKDNFEEIFEKLKNCGASFEYAHEKLPKIIKAHQPAAGVARAVYKKIKPNIDKTEKEFLDEWTDNIEALGTQAFFESFPIKDLNEDKEPKIYGNMSAKEYKAQRKYADSFPLLDTTALEERMQRNQNNLDIEDMLRHVLGDDNG